MKALLKKGLRKLYQYVAGTPAANSWEIYRDYIKVAPSAILGPASSVEVKYRPLPSPVCVEIGADSQIFGTLVILLPGAMIHIGERTQIGNSTLIATSGIEIGNDVLMAWGVTIMDNDSHALNWSERKNDVLQCGLDYRENPADFTRHKDWTNVQMAPVTIKDKAWIGFGVSILKGVTIGEGAVIGAGSVVTRNIPAYSLAAGNPARVIRQLTDNAHE